MKPKLDFYKNRLFLYFVTSLTAISILSYLIMAFSMRMIADDYCMTEYAQQLSISEFSRWYYLNWSGQFTYPFVKTLTYNIFGLNASITMPFLIYLSLWLGCIVLLRRVFRLWNWHGSTQLAMILGSLNIFILLSTMASRQTMYWLDALLFHVLPLSVLVWIVIGWTYAIQSKRKQLLKMLIFFAVMFIYGGMQILTSLFGLAYWFVTIILLWLFLPDDRRRVLPVTVTALLGNLSALAIVLLAPGNWRRLATFQATDTSVSYLEGATIALYATLNHWLSTFSISHFVLVFGAMIAICAIWYQKDAIPISHPAVRFIRKYFLLIIVVSIVIGLGYSVVSLLLPATAMGTTQTRVFVTAGLTKTMFSIWVGFVLGLRLVDENWFQKITPIFIVLGIGLLTMGSLYRIYGNVTIYEDYVTWSQEWDERHSALTEASALGATTVEVRPFDQTLPNFLGPSPDGMYGFTRSCMSNYYSIESLILNPDLEDDDVIRILEP